MKSNHSLVTLNLRLFEGAGAGAAGATGTGGASAPAADASGQQGAEMTPKTGKSGKNPLSGVVYGKQTEQQPQQGNQPDPTTKQKQPVTQTQVTTDTAESLKAEYDQLMSTKFKDLRSSDIEGVIKQRFRDNDALKAKAEKSEALDPILSMLASKYGVDPSDAKALAKAIEEDDSYYEQEAIEKGLSVDQLKQFKKMERENASLKKAQEEATRTQKANEIQQRWIQEGDVCKASYPSFDLANEAGNATTGNRFLSLLKSGVDVKTAYEVIHQSEIIGGAMQHTAATVQQKTVNDILARGQRPPENGSSGSGAALVVKKDPKTFTKQDREEIARRVRNGEQITL